MAERSETKEDDGPDVSELSDVSNVLLLSPSLGGHGRRTCLDLLSQTPPGGTNVLAITFMDSPADWVDDWMDHVGVQPLRGGIVATGQANASVDDPSWAVRTVENPADLTGIGIELSELLSRMAGTTEDEEHIAVCFDSITSLLQYADLQRTFRFLHVVTGRVKTVDGVGHYHLDPEAHDRQTVATLKGLFDAVIEVDADGSWSVDR